MASSKSGGKTKKQKGKVQQSLNLPEVTTPRVKELIKFRCEVPDPGMTREVGEEAQGLLRRLQHGENLSLPASRPIRHGKESFHELRIQESDGIWRLFYRFYPDAVVVVEVFWKTTQQTPLETKRLCCQRFAAYEAAVAAYEKEVLKRVRKTK